MRAVISCLFGALLLASFAHATSPPRPVVSHPSAELRTDGASDLQRRIASGEADPVADAKRAAQLGDFRFVWVVGFLFHAPMGLTCNAILHPNPEQILVTREISDVPDDCERTPDVCESQRQLDIYGAAYNRALVNEPQFPAPDVCRPSTPADDRIPKQDAVLRQVTPVRDVRARPHDLH